MEKAKINVLQLFSMMFIFNMGTALVLNYGSYAGKDSWVSILLAMCGGGVLFSIYYFLFRQYPRLLLTSYIREIFGKHLGWIIGLLYCLFFLYICGRNIREFGELLVSSTLTKTPLLVIDLTLILVMCYVIYLGVEVIGRTAEIFFIILLFLGAAGNFFVLVSGDVDFQQILPILEHGWKPILITSFPHLVIFPFGEMLVFTMLLPYLNKPILVKKTWLGSLVLSGLILSWTTLLNISVLGVDAMRRAPFPTLVAVGKVNLLDFIERLDAIVVFTLLITVFFKASVYLYCAVVGITDLFKITPYNKIVIPIGAIVIFLSVAMASSFLEQIEEGFLNLETISVILIIIIPLLMVLISLLRIRFIRNISK